MKLFRLIISNSKDLLASKSLVKRLISTGIATAVMAVATFLFTTDKSKHFLAVPAPQSEEQAAVATVEPLPRGLSRNRTDFIKALDLLADAADKNDHLEDYFDRVSKRVKGEHVSPEKGSGVRVIKAKRNLSSPADSTTVAANNPQVAKGEMKNYEQSAMIPSAETSAVASSDSAAQVESAEEGSDSSLLTVGDMSFDDNPAIQRWVNYYTSTQGGRQTMTIGLRRSQAYIEMAREEFRRAGVPEDLIWLALVESVWNPTAVSPAAAGGLWQFIPKTAIEYGLSVQQGNDERNNPLKQTRVAAEYLRDLYTIFGDWALAMAAYNSGEPRVMDAIVKNGRANFWDLYEKQLIPKETRDYVPKILAAIKVVSQADVYGFASGSANGSGSQTEIVFSGQ